MTSLYAHISLFLLLHNFGVMLGSKKANMAKDEGMSMLNLLHETWDEEILCEMGLFLCEKNHFFLCISCIDDDVGHHMVETWYLLVKGGHLTIQLEVILCIF